MSFISKLLERKIIMAANWLFMAGAILSSMITNAGMNVLEAGLAAETVSGFSVVNEIGKAGNEPYDFTIAFAGDINLDENWATTQHLNASPNGIYDCISPELIEEMQSADIMCLNNEFTYSTQGSPMAGKAYTFRAAPERVEILKTLGVDVVKLANNHIYD